MSNASNIKKNFTFTQQINKNETRFILNRINDFTK